MPTPKQGYFLKSGERVPGTTTIIGRFKDSGALIKWAYRQGREHEGLARRGLPAPSDLYDVTDAAAQIGTTVHGLVEKHIKAQGIDMHAFDAMDAKVKSGFDAYLSWERMTKLRIVEQEMGLVSETYRYGGTPDAVGIIDDGLCLLDWKTSNRVYADHLIQLAAYRWLWNECRPATPLTGGSHLCRFSKENGDFAHHYYPDLSEAWTAFVAMRELYDIDKVLVKRAA